MDDSYSNRELDMKFQILGEKVDENHRETTESLDIMDKKFDNKLKEVMNFLQEIKQQVTKTNGRMNKSEAFLLALKWAGGLALVIIIPLIVYIWTMQVSALNSRQDRQGTVIQQLLAK